MLDEDFTFQLQNKNYNQVILSFAWLSQPDWLAKFW